MAGIIPSYMAEHRIKANTFDRHPVSHRRGNFVGNVVEPWRTADPLGAGFSDEGRPPDAIVHEFEEFTRRAVDRIAHIHCSAVIYPLVVVVIVDPDKIKILGSAAEFGRALACEEIHRLKLGIHIIGRHAHMLGRSRLRQNVDQRLGDGEAGIGRHIADRLDRSDTRADEDRLDLAAAPSLERVQVSDVASSPGEEADLVDRREERDGVGFLRDDVSDRPSIGREACNKIRREQVNPIRHPVMEQIPDDLRARLARSADLREQ